MELTDWLKIGIRGGLLLSWFYVIFRIKNYIASDIWLTVGFWIYVVLHVAYVAIQSYKEYEDSI